MSNKFTLVYYYVPEDKDDPENPNAFGINLAQEDISLKDIRTAFPLEGEYHFRFKYKVNGNQIVWMDLPSERSGLPLFNGKIFMKATRFSWESKQNKEQYFDDIERQKAAKVSEEVKRETSKPKDTPKQQQPSNSYSNSDFDLLGSDTVTSKPIKTNGKTPDLWDHEETTTTTKKTNDLLDF